jgi:hypothetical protein
MTHHSAGHVHQRRGLCRVVDALRPILYKRPRFWKAEPVPCLSQLATSALSPITRSKKPTISTSLAWLLQHRWTFTSDLSLCPYDFPFRHDPCLLGRYGSRDHLPAVPATQDIGKKAIQGHGNENQRGTLCHMLYTIDGLGLNETQLHVYPIKSLRGCPVSSALATSHGLAHDRQYLQSQPRIFVPDLH